MWHCALQVKSSCIDASALFMIVTAFSPTDLAIAIR